jgi:hypothetical protein
VDLPATVTVGDAVVELRRATAADLPALVAMLADDPLGAGREADDGDLTPYRRAFDLVDADPATSSSSPSTGTTWWAPCSSRSCRAWPAVARRAGSSRPSGSRPARGAEGSGRR